MRARHRATPPRAVRGLIDSLRRLDRGVMRRARAGAIRRSSTAPWWGSRRPPTTGGCGSRSPACWRCWADRRGRAAAGRGLLALVIAGVTTNGPAKLLTRRRRPARPSRPALIRMPRSTSFPSGHSAAAFAFAAGAAAELPMLAPCSPRSRWRSATRACTPACTTRATWPRGPRSGSARRRWHGGWARTPRPARRSREVPTSPGARWRPPAQRPGERRGSVERWVPGVRALRTYERAWLRPDLVAGDRAGRDPRAPGHGLRRARRAARGHGAVHDDRVPGGVRRCSGPRACSSWARTPRSRR